MRRFKIGIKVLKNSADCGGCTHPSALQWLSPVLRAPGLLPQQPPPPAFSPGLGCWERSRVGLQQECIWVRSQGEDGGCRVELAAISLHVVAEP